MRNESWLYRWKCVAYMFVMDLAKRTVLIFFTSVVLQSCLFSFTSLLNVGLLFFFFLSCVIINHVSHMGKGELQASPFGIFLGSLIHT